MNLTITSGKDLKTRVGHIPGKLYVYVEADTTEILEISDGAVVSIVLYPYSSLRYWIYDGE